jgi:hypothetical protein
MSFFDMLTSSFMSDTAHKCQLNLLHQNDPNNGQTLINRRLPEIIADISFTRYKSDRAVRVVAGFMPAVPEQP